ncbi:MAG: DUF503 domain-containing protein [Acidobacteria bacterium]|nr:DUF503 domain-containing protein [Acidobacteriota bacterium]
MEIRKLDISFHLTGCHSLKEKRHRLKGLRDRFGSDPHTAVVESGFQDSHQQSVYTFVFVGQADFLDKTIHQLEAYLEIHVDAEVTGVEETLLHNGRP